MTEIHLENRKAFSQEEALELYKEQVKTYKYILDILKEELKLKDIEAVLKKIYSPPYWKGKNAGANISRIKKVINEKEKNYFYKPETKGRKPLAGTSYAYLQHGYIHTLLNFIKKQENKSFKLISAEKQLKKIGEYSFFIKGNSPEFERIIKTNITLENNLNGEIHKEHIIIIKKIYSLLTNNSDFNKEDFTKKFLLSFPPPHKKNKKRQEKNTKIHKRITNILEMETPLPGGNSEKPKKYFLNSRFKNKIYENMRKPIEKFLENSLLEDDAKKELKKLWKKFENFKDLDYTTNNGLIYPIKRKRELSDDESDNDPESLESEGEENKEAKESEAEKELKQEIIPPTKKAKIEEKEEHHKSTFDLTLYLNNSDMFSNESEPKWEKFTEPFSGGLPEEELPKTENDFPGNPISSTKGISFSESNKNTIEFSSDPSLLEDFKEPTKSDKPKEPTEYRTMFLA